MNNGHVVENRVLNLFIEKRSFEVDKKVFHCGFQNAITFLFEEVERKFRHLPKALDPCRISKSFDKT